MRLFGKNPVIERIKAAPQSIKKIYLEEGHKEASYLRKKAQKWGISVFMIPKTKILKMARHLNSQGILAEVEDFSYVSYEELLETALKKKFVLVFLDELKDPQNLGAILRSLACLGGFGLVLPKKDSVSITEAVCRVASGGENYVPVSIVSNLSNAIGQARRQGFWIAGTVVEGGEDIFDVSFSFPLGIVIGSEEKGIREVLTKNLDKKITIPMRQARLSFNAAQATTIIGYEITKQKTKNK